MKESRTCLKNRLKYLDLDTVDSGYHEDSNVFIYLVPD